MAEKQLTAANHEAVRKHLYDRIHAEGQRVKLDFPNTLRTAIEHEVWKHFTTAEGKPFADLVGWLTYEWINGGCSLGKFNTSLNLDDVLQLCLDNALDVHRVLAEGTPNAGRGRPKKAEGNGKENRSRDRFSRASSKSRVVLSVRLAQERPDFYEAYLRGEYRSVRAAAEAAGLVKPGHDPLQRLQSYWRKATAAQRRAFRKWLDSADAQTPPEVNCR
jgi:hypothetical protein